jgi:hypothetical protein
VRILIAIDVRRQWNASTAAVLFNHAAEHRKLGHDVEMSFLEDVVDPDAWPQDRSWPLASKVRNRMRSLVPRSH